MPGRIAEMTVKIAEKKHMFFYDSIIFPETGLNWYKVNFIPYHYVFDPGPILMETLKDFKCSAVGTY